MKRKAVINSIIIFLTFLCMVSCSKSQDESSLTSTSRFERDTDTEQIDERTLDDTFEPESEKELELSDRNVVLPYIMFSNSELSAEITTTDGTLYLSDGEDSTLTEYSVSCLYGYLDKEKGVRRDLADNTFTYTISTNMEEDLITIKVFGEDGYGSTTYFYVKKAFNEKGIPIFKVKKTN